MKSAIIKELIEEYARFHSIEEEMDLMDQIKLYEALNNKIERSGLSLYEVSRRFHLAKAG
ncbi:MAG: hypothetical protein ABJP45_10925 [Cyclobacteriaceae bacterium]